MNKFLATLVLVAVVMTTVPAVSDAHVDLSCPSGVCATWTSLNATHVHAMPYNLGLINWGALKAFGRRVLRQLHFVI